jgi:hypothetical protein
MTTYVISEQPNAWHVHRYGVDTVSVLGVTHSEEQARSIASDYAGKDAPSRIMRIAMNGMTSVIAFFRESVQSG